MENREKIKLTINELPLRSEKLSFEEVKDILEDAWMMEQNAKRIQENTIILV